MRARDLGVAIGEHPTGPHNAITDVAGVQVGHTTITSDDPRTVRTGAPVGVRTWTSRSAAFAAAPASIPTSTARGRNSTILRILARSRKQSL